MQVQLLKVVDGQSSVLATLKSTSWLSNKWIRLTLTTVGDQLYVQVFRTDTAQYLAADGSWQYSATQALHVQDGALASDGFAGVARVAKYAGTVQFDNFATAEPASDLVRESIIEERFSRPVPGGLPAGWTQWSENAAAFRVSTTQTLTDSAAFRTSLANQGVIRAWYNTDLPADVDIGATVYLEGSAPAQIIGRGRDLATNAPSYYAVRVTSGMQLQLLRVVNGETSVIGSLQSNEALAGKWVRITLSMVGSDLRVSAYRVDIARYLNDNGDWEVMPVWAMEVTDSAISGSGRAGVGRGDSAAGRVTIDSFVVTKNPAQPSAAGGSFNFDANPGASLPGGWSQWNSNATGGFSVSNQQASSSPNGLMSDGGSGLESRTWLNNFQAADAQVGADVYLNSLVPTQLILRGQNLDSDSPSYYAASLTRGLDVQLIRVDNGQTTVLTDVSSATWDTNLWVRLNFAVQGNTLQLQVIRLDNGKYLDQDGNWETDPAIAASVNDTSLPGAGFAGIGRPAIYSGQISIDNVDIQSLAATPPSDVPPIETPPVTTPPIDPATDGESPTPTDPGTTGTPTSETPAPTTPTPTAPPPVDTPTSTPSSLPSVPQHLSHIRIAQFAYYGTTIGSVEKSLLKNDIDLVIANTGLVDTIGAVSSQTPQFIYTNASNIYRELLTDWLNYADAHGISREEAFYHVTQPTPFTGDSASSWPVNWFWSVYLGADGNWLDKTSFARDTTQSLTLGDAGQSLLLGNTERFREINFDLVSGASAGWQGRWSTPAPPTPPAIRRPGRRSMSFPTAPAASRNRAGSPSIHPPTGPPTKWATGRGCSMCGCERPPTAKRRSRAASWAGTMSTPVGPRQARFPSSTSRPTRMATAI